MWMKHSEALLHLEHLLAAVQKARSIIFETEEKAGSRYLDEATMHLFDKLLFGEKNLATQLIRTLELDLAGTKQVTAMEFFNYMSVAGRHGPIQVCSFDYDWGKSVLPAPDSNWIRGWEPEETEEAA
jgi:hypothetical protein